MYIISHHYNEKTNTHGAPIVKTISALFFVAIVMRMLFLIHRTALQPHFSQFQFCGKLVLPGLGHKSSSRSGFFSCVLFLQPKQIPAHRGA